MELRLVGTGIHPQIDVSLGSGKDLCLDMGHAMAKDVLSKTFTLLNSSPIQVRYHLIMETQLKKASTTKSFSEYDAWRMHGTCMAHAHVHPCAGACNYSGQPAFVCVPSEGVVMGESSKEVRIFFSPDHQSKAYSDRLLVEYNGKVCRVPCLSDAPS